MNADGDKGGKTILLVEDDDVNRTIVAEMLKDMGYMVIEKPDVTTALELVHHKDTPIDLVITDYRLPDTDGFTLVDVARKALPGVPIIMMTAYGNAENYIRSMSLGVFEYLNKPVKKKEFERIVRFALRKPHSA